MRPSYADYVKHMTRYYLKAEISGRTRGERESDANNFYAVQTVLSHMSESDQAHIKFIYNKSFESLAEAVKQRSASTGVTHKYLWYLIGDYERKCAMTRGLV